MSLTAFVNQLKLSWWHFIIGLFILAWPLAASLYFLYDRLFFIHIGFLKLNLLLMVIVIPLLLVNAFLIHALLKVRSVVQLDGFGFKSSVRSAMMSLFIVVWLLVGANICGMLKIELHALWLYAALAEGLVIFILLVLIYLEYVQRKSKVD